MIGDLVMDRKMILDKMLKIFNDNGIIILEGDLEQPLDIDSLRFISIIVQIEEVFGIIVPDELLIMQEYPDINSFVCMVSEVLA